MQQELIDRLEAPNARFYATHAAEFARTRGAPWPGWRRLLDFEGPQSVLDVGCGHGRFFEFLAKNKRLPVRALGLDTAAELLAQAKPIPGFEPDYQQHSLHDLDGLDEQFDWVTLFGVMHHVPGYETRQDILRSLARRVAPGGHLVVTYWRFADQSRFSDRLGDARPAGIDLDQLEDGDHLLPWSDTSLRYVHQVTEAELDRHRRLLKQPVLHEWASDGATRNMNLYLCWRL